MEIAFFDIYIIRHIRHKKQRLITKLQLFSFDGKPNIFSLTFKFLLCGFGWLLPFY